MAHISDEVVKQSIIGIKGILEEYKNELERAYCNAEDDLTVSIRLRYSVPKKGSGISIQTDLSFMLEKIKIKTETIIDPNKDNLFVSSK